jgi:hypothetical protein
VHWVRFPDDESHSAIETGRLERLTIPLEDLNASNDE